jgi:hypothetical protein
MGRRDAAPEPDARQINVKDGQPQPAPTFYHGAVRVRLLPGPRPAQAKEPATLVLDVAVEPAVTDFVLGPDSRLTRAVDDQGQNLTAKLTSAPAAGRPQRAAPQLQIQRGEKAAKTLKEISGELSGQVMAPAEPLVKVDDIFNAAGKTVRGAQGTAIEVFTVEKKGDGEVQIALRMETPLALAGVRAATYPALVDAKGESYQLLQVPSRGGRSNGRVFTQELTLLYRAHPGQGDPAKLVLNAVEPVNLQVPFTLKDVPLP